MTAALKNDGDLKQAVIAFIKGAREDAEAAAKAFKGGAKIGLDSADFQLLNGVPFSVKPATRTAQQAIIKRCNALLGPVHSHESDVYDIIWQTVARQISENPGIKLEVAQDEILKELGTGLSGTFRFIDDNYTISFGWAKGSIDIGPVSAIDTEKLSEDLALEFPDAKWKVKVGPTGFTVHQTGEVEALKTQTVWRVNLVCARNNVVEQAAWLIDVALSLLRLSHTKAGTFFPRIGQVEAPALRPPAEHNTAIVLAGTSADMGGMTLASHYHVDEQLKAIVESEPFKANAALIFSPPKGSVAERVAQGLGWMTRGRQTADRAERLLFFFTAIEALLSSDDKSAPVVQTIARHASVILAEQPNHRAELAAQIRRLYGERSALVHAGKRGVTKSSADTVQYLTEALYRSVLNQVGLGSSFAKFNSGLANASYGSPWP